MHFSGVLVRAIVFVWLAGLVLGDFGVLQAQATELGNTAQFGKFLRKDWTDASHVQDARLTAPDTIESDLTSRSGTTLARRWAMTKARLQVETQWLNSCNSGACRDPRAAIWLKTVNLIRTASYKSRPALVQQLFSRRIKYVTDRAGDDHWATPLATLLRRAGDCEDHVLLKRAVLLAAGYRETNIRMLILETAEGRGHMALLVNRQRPIILDNRYRYPVAPEFLKKDRIAAIATDRGYFVSN